MNTYWNILYLEHPPYATWSVKSLSKTDRNINLFKNVLNKAIKDFESMDILHSEAATLSRFIYRMKSKFRNDKGLRSMVALNKALINYYNMFLPKAYKNLESIIEMEDGTYILPSKQMIQYVLVRTQGFAKLMTQIGNTARYAAHFLKARISLGHAWSIALLAYANVSRIWFCSRHILRRSCSWYDELYSCSKNFEYVGTHWIPRNQSLPCDLRAWLSSESQMNMSDTTEEKIFEKSFVEEAFDTNEISFDTSNEITIDFPKLSQENASTDNILSDDSSSDNDDIDDIGEVITRETFEENLPKVSPNPEIPLSRKRKYVTDNKRKTTGKFKKIKSKT
ncbi:uncharacterized protein LOC105258928 [Camponotus floridanus]|uniref:uncharacterized protein LOC105258928 n=1 Tax=Camponotus floridanus TaxID=104421 RepID=UPI00059D7F86|nr:uncharacterized protein LOC105258928 [Camponotus floridanus]